jgi:hypothetical protein
MVDVEQAARARARFRVLSNYGKLWPHPSGWTAISPSCTIFYPVHYGACPGLIWLWSQAWPILDSRAHTTFGACNYDYCLRGGEACNYESTI